MKSSTVNKLIVLIVFLFVSSCKEAKVRKDIASTKNDISQFLGQWTFDIGPRAEVPGSVGWIEVRKEGEYLDANLLWGGGAISPVPYIYTAGNILYVGMPPRRVVLTRGEDGNQGRSLNYPTWLEIKVNGKKFEGYQRGPKLTGIGFDSIIVTGTKLPDVPPTPDLSKLKFGKPINLIINPNGLTGWRLVEADRTSGWSMKDGILTNDPVQKEGTQHITYGNLRTDQEFKDFNLKLDVKVYERSNSGIYLRGMVEVQVADSYERPLHIHNSIGAIFSRIAPTVKAEKPLGEWQTLDITYVDRHVTVKLNGITTIDNQPVYGPTGGALHSDVFASGPIYLQGDHSKASYRNLVLTPIIK